jgi:subtilisin
VTRRGALKGLGGAAALWGVGVGGPDAAASNGDGTARVTVGYESAAAERAASETAAEVVYEFGFDAVTVRADLAAVEAFRRRPDVRYVERDGVYEVASQTTPWGIDRVDADAAHGRDRTGEGADVAVVDTGIDGNHGDLAPNLGEGTAFQGGTQHGSWQDDNGHGTHVAGTVGAVDDASGVVGVAPAVTLHPVKVIASPGFGLTSDIAKGIDWAADREYDVVNLSLEGDHLEAVADACEYAAEQGVVLVAAAGTGNGGSDCVRYPAAYPAGGAVSSPTRDDDLAGHSSKGPEVEVAAPGTRIYSAYLGGYATLSGTSMACPHVAGAAAHLAAAGRSREEIRETLVDTAEDVGLSSNEAGGGLLDVAAALDVEADDGAASESDDPPATPEADPDTGTETPASSSAEPREEAAAGPETPASNESGAPDAPVDARTETPTPTATETSTPTATEAPTRTPADASGGTPTPTEREPPSTSRTPTPSGDGLGLGSVWNTVTDVVRAALDGLT